jgi:hypothetical protein
VDVIVAFDVQQLWGSTQPSAGVPQTELEKQVAAFGTAALSTNGILPGLVAIEFANLIGAAPTQVTAALSFSRYRATITINPLSSIAAAAASDPSMMLPAVLAATVVESINDAGLVVSYSGVVLSFCFHQSCDLNTPCCDAATTTGRPTTAPTASDSSTAPTEATIDEATPDQNQISSDESQESAGESSGIYIVIAVAVMIIGTLAVLTYTRKGRHLKQESAKEATALNNAMMMEELEHQRPPTQVNIKNSLSTLTNVQVNAAMTETEFAMIVNNLADEGDVLEYNSVIEGMQSQQAQVAAAVVAQSATAWASSNMDDDFDDYEL